MKRMEIIERAPPEQKEELQKIDIHPRNLAVHRGEAGLKETKENMVIESRGLQDAFAVQTGAWDDYIAAKVFKGVNAGFTHEQLAKIEELLRGEQDPYTKRLPELHALVLSLAPSPQALALAKQAQSFAGDLDETYSHRSDLNKLPTKAKLLKIDPKLDRLFEKLKKLLRVAPEQTKKDCDAVTDLQIFQDDGLGF